MGVGRFVGKLEDHFIDNDVTHDRKQSSISVHLLASGRVGEYALEVRQLIGVEIVEVLVSLCGRVVRQEAHRDSGDSSEIGHGDNEQRKISR